ncbi:MAG: UbiA family prenyltransferase [Sedimentisphaerales bacterium]|nr:UbiA family prenyltransferase [Sedimentisphaerales bacterium]
MLGRIVTLLRMIRFSHSVFALPFAVMAAFLAGDAGRPGYCGTGKLFLIVWCMVWARTVAMTFNRIVDAELDARNPRTADRALPRGRISRRQALGFLYVASLLFGLGTYLFYQPLGLDALGFRWFGYGNYLPAILAVPVLVFICVYSLTKRFTWMSHFWLGACLMLAPLAAWIAISPPAGPWLDAQALVLGLAVLFWVAGFDIIYACQDISVDRRDGLHSLPQRLGIQGSLWLSRICHSLTVTFLLVLGMLAPLGGIYRAAVAVTAILLVAEHILVARGRVKLAFDLNGPVGILLAAATIWDIMA